MVEIDYRFVNGLSFIRIEEQDKPSETAPGTLGCRSGAFSGRYKNRNPDFLGIILCRKYEDGFDYNYYKAILTHEIGHHVTLGLINAKKYQEISNLWENSSWANSWLKAHNISDIEYAAVGFTMYQLGGELFRTLSEYYEGDAAFYDWLKTNLFCDQEFPNQLCSWQVIMGDELLWHNQCARALSAYYNALTNFPGDTECEITAQAGIASAKDRCP
ncbi:MAG: hypothetical protein KKC80_06340 [Candidatus Margulisbacteria bacterium]|nr:hypothetical protein [Candidatus Margulisiibacteriota bacterium]MBU1617646.1 hypothetical protein [Candidatus Margulisiibacteriota bacterium]